MLIGGAICVSDGKLSIDDSSFVNNSADYGGAIYVNYGDLTISNSTLFNNTVSSDGNAIYNYGVLLLLMIIGGVIMLHHGKN